MSERNVWIGVGNRNWPAANSELPIKDTESEVEVQGTGEDSELEPNQVEDDVSSRLLATGLPLDELVPRSWPKW
ncbi:MAG: hypothetical protein AAB624_01370 [Patescibacteria group bacterium]